MKTRLGPVWVLLFVAPLIAEVLAGSVPLTQFPGLLLLIGLYGGGALLIRELIRRRRLNWYWLLLLGVAYALFEEGLVLGSLFNPHYPHLYYLGRYGRAFGVNWVWAAFIVGYHAIFSVTLPILILESAFPKRAMNGWLSRRQIALIAGLLGVSAVLLIVFQSVILKLDYTATNPVAYIGCLVVIVAVVVAAFRARASQPSGITTPLLRPARLGMMAFFGALMWFSVRIFLIDPTVPFWYSLIGYAILAVLAGLVSGRLYRARAKWTQRHTFAVATSPLPLLWLFGFITTAAVSAVLPVDLIFHALLAIPLFMGIYSVRRVVMADQARQ